LDHGHITIPPFLWEEALCFRNLLGLKAAASQSALGVELFDQPKRRLEFQIVSDHPIGEPLAEGRIGFVDKASALEDGMLERKPQTVERYEINLTVKALPEFISE